MAFMNPSATAEIFFMTTMNKESSACIYSHTAAS